jgi:hypothetical protein
LSRGPLLPSTLGPLDLLAGYVVDPPGRTKNTLSACEVRRKGAFCCREFEIVIEHPVCLLLGLVDPVEHTGERLPYVDACGKGNIDRFTDDGDITEGKVVKGSEPFGITVAPDGDPWYTMFEANKIATLQLR